MIVDPHLTFNKRAVVLFNLGGPSNTLEIKNFLFNLFYDKAIINLPNPFRYLLANIISTSRLRAATEIYKNLGGKSPILENTLIQADLLQNLLTKEARFINEKNELYRVFVAMRYSSPRASQVLKQVADWNPDEVILLPLYPQYSMTTTQSSFDEWYKECKKVGFDKKTIEIISYEAEVNFIKAQVEIIKNSISNVSGKFRILFSAHGLPQKNVDRGDPYQKHIIASVNKICELLPDNIDYTICYQSKVGPLKWLEPSTEHEIIRAGKDGFGVVVVPIAFVSEHSETLVELDLEYKDLATECSVPFYIRVPTVFTNAHFLECLKTLVFSNLS